MIGIVPRVWRVGLVFLVVASCAGNDDVADHDVPHVWDAEDARVAVAIGDRFIVATEPVLAVRTVEASGELGPSTPLLLDGAPAMGVVLDAAVAPTGWLVVVGRMEGQDVVFAVAPDLTSRTVVASALVKAVAVADDGSVFAITFDTLPVTLRAFEASGAERWSVPVGADSRDLTALASGEVASVDNGSVTVHAAATGERVRSEHLAVGDILTPDGGRIVFDRPVEDGVDLVRFEVDGAERWRRSFPSNSAFEVIVASNDDVVVYPATSESLQVERLDGTSGAELATVPFDVRSPVRPTLVAATATQVVMVGRDGVWAADLR